MLAICVVIVVIILYVYMLSRCQSYTDGVWCADRTFMRSQEMSICRFYIVGDRVVVLVSDAEGVVYDSVYKFSCKPSARGWLSPFTGIAYYTINIPGTIFTNMRAVINIVTNQMVMTNSDICVTMYKNGEESMNYFRELAM